MSDAAADANKPAAADKPKSASSLPTILLLVNIIVVAAAAGMLVYTRIIFKRPAITEQSERKRLEALKSKPVVGNESGLVEFEPLTANLAGSGGRKRYATVGFALEIRDKNRANDIETVRALIIDKFLSILGKKQMTELNQVQGRFVLRSEMIDAVNQVIFNNLGSLQATKAAVKAAPAKEAPKEGGEGGEGGGEGGEKKEGAEAGAPGAAKSAIEPIRDLVTDVFFTQFIVQ
jgi:flagellar basal body-associated protein FliL